MSIRDRIKRLFLTEKEADPKAGYDLWSGEYDNQPGNLMLDLDELIFSLLLKETSLSGKTIVDVGCGTGRHWAKIREQDPARLVGYDASPGMLDKLKEKFPGAETFLTEGHLLSGLENKACDMIISTLTVAHIEKVEEAFREWDRVLKASGEIILTDYHPDALTMGARRTFSYQGKTVAVKNYIHPVKTIKRLAEQLGFREIRFIERKIDDSVKGYYEKQNAVGLFEQFRGVGVIYGMYLKKDHDPL